MNGFPHTYNIWTEILNRQSKISDFILLFCIGSDAKTAKREAHDQINMLTTEMCEIENKIEAEYLGKWQINIECLVGCTLLMPGDEYKVSAMFMSSHPKILTWER